MRLVFDLDDTICRAQNRDYPNAAAITSVVENIRACREVFPGVEVVIHTSRGMASCGGDVAKADKKNRATIEQWLAKHDLHVDEIIFGKPLGDIYIDDKAMSAEDFGCAKLETFHGFSGARISRIGDIVIKEADNVVEQQHWYEEAERHYADKGYINVPKVYGVTLGKMYLQYAPGEMCSRIVDKNIGLIDAMLNVVAEEQPIAGENDLNAYADYIGSRAEYVGLETSLCDKLRVCEPLRKRTFCHGDYSLLNMIYNDGRVTLIDPSPKPFMSTWLMDAGKLLASIICLDEALEGIRHGDGLKRRFERYFESREGVGTMPAGTLDVVRLVCQSHIVRVWYYAKKMGKANQEQKLSTYYHSHYGE